MGADEPFGRFVSLYGRELIRSLPNKALPIIAEEVADFLGYEVQYITEEDINEGPPEIRQILDKSPSHLLREENKILVKSGLPDSRKRLCVFHECGHDQIPWHSDYNYHCLEKHVLKPSQHNIAEREAFLCGAEMMWPYYIFLDHLTSLPTGVSAIQTLARDHRASREATAIRYVHVHPGICGIVAVERCTDLLPHLHQSPPCPNGQLELRLNVKARTVQIPQTLQNVYKVKYLSSSPRFDKYVPPGSVIPIDEPHLLELDHFPFRQIELPIGVLGSRSKARFMAESLILDQQSLMLILLWVPDRQGSLW
jgi:hypothetical protein